MGISLTSSSSGTITGKSFYDRLPANTHLYSWQYGYSAIDDGYEIRVVLLLPDDKRNLTEYKEVRMEMYIQAELVIDHFSDLRMWKQPHIEICGSDSRTVEAYLNLYVFAT